jgi:hypothetical protein
MKKKRKPGLIPHFSRVQRVLIVDDGILLCACMRFERMCIAWHVVTKCIYIPQFKKDMQVSHIYLLLVE